MEAIISPCQKYRYRLERDTGPLWPEKGRILFIMLNPSKADAEINDPTITRCIGFANTWFRSGLVVGNLYAYRATKPKDLWCAHDPIGPENDHYLLSMMAEIKDVICAWGNNAKPDRVKAFLSIAKKADANLYHLGITKAGQPQHPLFIKSNQKPIPWEAHD